MLISLKWRNLRFNGGRAVPDLCYISDLDLGVALASYDDLIGPMAMISGHGGQCQADIPESLDTEHKAVFTGNDLDLLVIKTTGRFSEELVT